MGVLRRCARYKFMLPPSMCVRTGLPAKCFSKYLAIYYQGPIFSTHLAVQPHEYCALNVVHATEEEVFFALVLRDQNLHMKRGTVSNGAGHVFMCSVRTESVFSTCFARKTICQNRFRIWLFPLLIPL